MTLQFATIILGSLFVASMAGTIVSGVVWFATGSGNAWRAFKLYEALAVRYFGPPASLCAILSVIEMLTTPK